MDITEITPEVLTDKNRFRNVCEQLARLHCLTTPDTLLTHMGEGFLKNVFYRSLIASPDAVILVVMDGETVAGFVVATVNVSKWLQQILMTYPLRSMWYGFMFLVLHLKLWRRVLEAVCMHTPETNQRSAENLMIATDVSYRGRGFGMQLLSALESKLQRQGVGISLARIRNDNTHALRIYTESGYHEIGTVTLNGKVWKWLVREEEFL